MPCIAPQDEQNRVIDSQPRSVTVKQRLLGRGAYVLVLNEAGELLVSKRTTSKVRLGGRRPVFPF